MKGGKKELVSEPPVSNNNSKPLGKPEDPQVGDTNDSSNQNQENHSSTHHDNSPTTSDIHTTSDYTDSHPTNDNIIIGE